MLNKKTFLLSIHKTCLWLLVFFCDKDKKLFILPSPTTFIPSGTSLWQPFMNLKERIGANLQKNKIHVENMSNKAFEYYNIYSWTIIHNPSMFWDIHIMVDIMYMYVILHNMVIEDDVDLNYIHVLITKPFTWNMGWVVSRRNILNWWSKF